jgi:virginiamycin B lyase
MRPSTLGSFGLVATCLLAAVFSAAPLSADPLGQITVVATGGTTPGFTANTQSRTITTGSDGNLWFLESATDAVARITPDGAVSEFPVPGAGAFVSLFHITAGPDGALWFTGFNPPGHLYRATTDGTVTEVAQGGVTPGFPAGNIEDIVTGPDGNLWATRPFQNPADELVRITPGGTITGFGGGAGLPADSTLRFITVGADGNLYITDSGQGQGEPPVPVRVWRFNLTTSQVELVATAGTTPGFTAGNFIGDITSGPDGNLWFLFNAGASTSGIARLTLAGEVTEFTAGIDPTANLQNVTSGCDGALWFTQAVEDNSVGKVLRSTTDGTVTAYTEGLPDGASLVGITSGPDDNLWVIDGADPGAVLRVGAGCGEAPPPAPAPAPVPVTVTPRFTG